MSHIDPYTKSSEFAKIITYSPHTCIALHSIYQGDQGNQGHQDHQSGCTSGMNKPTNRVLKQPQRGIIRIQFMRQIWNDRGDQISGRCS